ncbi:MAG: GAF domain-containing protein [Deltaproteobacteria bacterium]|nr:GAF domain-containing protein [Deltaproteobacteria bacterium]
MRIGSLELDRSFLESRVARRIFAVVASCALLPVAVFALFSYQQVRNQLEDDAALALQRESKAAGMAIVERLLLAEDALRLVIADRVSGGGLVSESAVRALSSVRAVPGGDSRLANLSRRERAHLAQGGSLIVLESGEAGGPTLLMLRLRSSPEASGGAWLATLEPEFVFTGQRRMGFDRYWVSDRTGYPVYWAPADAFPGRTRPRRERLEPKLAETVEFDGEKWLSSSWSMFLAAAFGAPAWTVGVARPLSEIHRPLHQFEVIFPWVTGITLLGALGLTLFQVRRSLIPIAALTEGTRRLAAGDLQARVKIESHDEFGDLSRAFNEMARVIGSQVDVLATVNRIGASLSAEFDEHQLLTLILLGSMQVTRAEAGVLFELSDEGDLELSAVRLGEGIAFTDEPINAVLPRLPARRCVERGAVVRVDDLQRVDEDEHREWAALEQTLGTAVRAYVAVPLQAENGRTIGVLLLMRHRDESFSDEACSLAVSLASQAAVSIRKNALMESFRSLFEGLIQLTAKAIDEKSPYTGDHCRKVPILTEMIADAVCTTEVGPLKDFTMNQEERYELRIAALLHDCGKVVTPVNVMDKATKLESIFDRIELVGTRFEILRRDAAVRALARRLGEAEADSILETDTLLARELESIDADMAFLRVCNVGSEHMPESDRERVREIARRHRWLPADTEGCDILDAEEVMNLTIAKGTLNDDEREVINQHVVTTISLLEELPFPNNMRNVPAIAGAHHEHVDGSGYPRELRGEQLCVQARMLGLADVFEALTAKDRPYKPGRTLSETLEILAAMCRDDHLDADLFDVLVREKIHIRYAAKYLSPEQIDSPHREVLEQMTSPWESS